jgi:hypothetical protein
LQHEQTKLGRLTRGIYLAVPVLYIFDRIEQPVTSRVYLMASRAITGRATVLLSAIAALAGLHLHLHLHGPAKNGNFER